MTTYCNISPVNLISASKRTADTAIEQQNCRGHEVRDRSASSFESGI